MKKLVVRVPDDLMRQFKAKAAANGMTLQMVVAQLIAKWLRSAKPGG